MSDETDKNIPKWVLIVLKMDKKQTAVEWLVEQIKSDQNQKSLSSSEWMKVINQAKQMEKEQMQKLIIWMYKVSADQPMRFETDIDDIVEQYYNETYGKTRTTG